MIDYYLRFDSEAQAIDALKDYEGSIDVIGVIYEQTGVKNNEPVMSAIPGWHVNVRGKPDKILSKYAVEVATPYRIWA